MSSTTATVETLTAEVRVLMVGNRQVTLSVARQLDWCELEEMEPFGRVKLGDSDAVIGRHRETGALVNARYRKYFGKPFVSKDDLSGPIIVCSAWRSSRDGVYPVRFLEREIEIQEKATTKCGNEKHTGWGYGQKEECPHWSTDGHDSEIKETISRFDRWIKVNRDAAALPLIVLAGLR